MTVNHSNHSTLTTAEYTGHAPFPWPGRFTLLLLCLTVAVPMLAAYWLFENTSAQPQNTINKGSLLTPAVQLSYIDFNDDQGHASDWLEQRYWRMVTVVDHGCQSLCQQKLYQSRQVHVRLAKHAERIQRVLLVVSDQPDLQPLADLTRRDSGLQVLTVTTAQWQQVIAHTSRHAGPGHLLLVDQEGFAMMSYGADHTGSDLLADLTRLLKYSYQ